MSESGAEELAMARTLDFRRKRWGHNLEIKTTSPGVLSGFCWSTPGPRENDLILWKTEYGHAVGQVTKSEWMTNVDDMFDIAVRIVERVGKSGEILWSDVSVKFGPFTP